MKSGFCITTGDNQLSSWTEKKLQSISQSQTCTKKRSWSLFGGLIHYSFPNPSKTITSEKYAQQIDEMHWKLKHLMLTLVNRMGPILLHDNTWPHIAQPMLQKSSELGYEVLPHTPYSPDLLPTDYHFFKQLDNFWQGKCFHNQHVCVVSRFSHVQLFATLWTVPPSRMQKILSKSLSNLEALIFMLQE